MKTSEKSAEIINEDKIVKNESTCASFDNIKVCEKKVGPCFDNFDCYPDLTQFENSCQELLKQTEITRTVSVFNELSSTESLFFDESKRTIHLKFKSNVEDSELIKKVNNLCMKNNLKCELHHFEDKKNKNIQFAKYLNTFNGVNVVLDEKTSEILVNVNDNIDFQLKFKVQKEIEEFTKQNQCQSCVFRYY